jgi:hypothetical protein
MLSRRSVLLAAVAASATLIAPAVATEIRPFDPDSFEMAQQAGKPIFGAARASWRPI